MTFKQFMSIVDSINITQMIMDIIATYHEPSHLGTLFIALIISHILLDVAFDIKHEF